MHQIIFIRGGETFDNNEQFYSYLKNVPYNPFEKRKNWRDWIEWAMSTDYEMMAPVMPNKQNADYLAWKIWFERLFPFLNDQKLIIIGQSLGGLFVAKYLSENQFPKIINQLHLCSPVFSSDGLTEETAGNFILDPSKLASLEQQAEEIYLYHSHDDKSVPFSHSEQYRKFLPKVIFQEFDGRGHFTQPAFPELLENVYKIKP